MTPIKFIYSEKATKLCKISTVYLSYVVPVKSTVEISQNFVAFSEYMNFKIDLKNSYMKGATMNGVNNWSCDVKCLHAGFVKYLKYATNAARR